MAAVIAYTLPAMHLVCQLVVSGHSGVNVTESVSHPSTTQPPPQNKIYTPLPDGYVANFNLGFAYKHHTSYLTVFEAKNACEQEGAKLTVIDSVEKMEYIGSQVQGSWVHAGIFRVVNDKWININTGEPVTSIVWKANYPTEGNDCAQLFSSDGVTGLGTFLFNDREDFFCEIPILVNSMINVN